MTDLVERVDTEIAVAFTAASEVSRGGTPVRLVRPVRPVSVPRIDSGGWTRRYAATLMISDSLAAAAAVAGGWLVRFSVPLDEAWHGYVAFSACVVVGWLLCLHVVGGYEVQRISTGAREAQRVIRAAVEVAGGLAIVAYLAHIDVARSAVAGFIPAGTVLMLLGRYVVRHAVHRRRARGEWTSAILAVGTSESVRHLVAATRRNPFAGLRVVGACVEDAEVGAHVADGVPVLGGVARAAELAEITDADIVAVAGAGLGPRRIRELGWALEGTGRNMVMAPGLTDVAGPRVHVSPVEGLPLMWVDQPAFSGFARIGKRAMDVLGAALLLLVSAPFLLLVGLAVRMTSAGPALYRSTRMGADGRAFTVYKFRSMYRDADQHRAELAARNQADGVLFKIRDDPRITPVGRVLRKFSLDELPQLLNVVAGSMSLVGPRPPLPDEVERYQADAHRRLLVKPGMTGLWQVSGRSDLSWDESVRLDLYYVENWSLGLDLAIIGRTVWAVLRSRGAY